MANYVAPKTTDRNRLSKKELLENEQFNNLLKQFEITSDGLLEILNDNDIEVIELKVGDEFSPKDHRINEIKTTRIPELNNKIESIVSKGFVDINTHRLVRNPEVNIYKLAN